MLPPRKTRGQQQMFYCFDPETFIPEDYILRKIDRLIDFGAIRKRLAELYVPAFGRPAIDPEVMFRILLVGYLFGLSENQLFRELRMHLGYRWFCKLAPDERVPDRSTLNKLRNHRWAEAGIIGEFLEMVIEQCIAHGLVKARYLSVDGTQVEANASISRFEPVEVEETVGEYLERMGLTQPEQAAQGAEEVSPEAQGDSVQDDGFQEKVVSDTAGKASCEPPKSRTSRRDFRGEKLSNRTHRCRTDPDARLYRKGPGKEAKLSYLMHDLVDAESGVILGRCVTEARSSAEREAALRILDEVRERHPGLLTGAALLGDKNYCTGDFLAAVEERGLEPYVSVRSDLKPREIRQYKRPARDRRQAENRERKRRAAKAVNRLLERAETPEYRAVQKLRLTNERIVAEAKELGMDRTRYRGLPKVERQALMTAAVQNLRRLLTWISRRKGAPALRLVVPKPQSQSVCPYGAASFLLLSRWIRHRRLILATGLVSLAAGRYGVA